jgi:hypothetical protein
MYMLYMFVRVEIIAKHAARRLGVGMYRSAGNVAGCCGGEMLFVFV